MENISPEFAEFHSIYGCPKLNIQAFVLQNIQGTMDLTVYYQVKFVINLNFILPLLLCVPFFKCTLKLCRNLLIFWVRFLVQLNTTISVFVVLVCAHRADKVVFADSVLVHDGEVDPGAGAHLGDGTLGGGGHKEEYSR